MKISFLPIFVPLVMFSCHKKNVDGYYTGAMEMCSVDSTGKKICYGEDFDPKHKWYHLSLLKIKDGKVFMDQSPIAVENNDTSYSASDGGFFYYQGSEVIKGDSVILNLTQVSCDYCAQRIMKPGEPITKETKRLAGRVTDGGLILNGVLFKRTKPGKKLISE